jgi:hypothetical protein
MENHAEQKILRARSRHRNLVAKYNPYAPKVQRSKRAYKRREKYPDIVFES